MTSERTNTLPSPSDPPRVGVWNAEKTNNDSVQGPEQVSRGTSADRSSAFFVIMALATITLLSYFKSLQCFFFSDDLLCLDYLHAIFNGKPQLLLERLSSSWQDSSISLLYRPLADLSLVFDYAFWQSNPLGYHLTNMFLHASASTACFFLVSSVLRSAKILRTEVPAFLSAALFASYPLHVEPVLWICCRTDLASTTLVLLFLWASIQQSNKQSQDPPGLLACLAYLAALMFKESAACTIPILVSYLVLFGKSKRSISSVFRFVIPFVALTAAYFSVRLMVLGTLFGGYTGALGASMTSNWWNRIMDPEMPVLLALASNVTVFKEGDPLFTCVHMVFFAVAATLLVRIPFLPWTSATNKLLLFFAAAAFCSIAPAFQVAGLTPTLSNSRIFYMASAFYVPLAVVAVFPLCESAVQSKLEERLRVVCVSLLSSLTIVYAGMCNIAITPWIEASSIIRTIQKETVEKIIQTRQTLGRDAKVTILNIPATIGGAHLMYEFRELATLTGPAFFTGKDYQKTLTALDEYPDFVSPRTNLLASQLGDHKHKGFWFSRKSDKLIEIPNTPTLAGSEFRSNSEIQIKPAQSCGVKGQKAYFAKLPADQALNSDLIEVAVNFKKSAQRPVLTLAFTHDGKTPCDADLFYVMIEYGKDGTHTYTVPTAVLRRAVDLKACNQLYFRLSNSCELTAGRVISAKLQAKCEMAKTTSAVATQNGKFLAGNDALVLNLDAKEISNARGIYVELSKPNHFLNFGKVNASNPVPSKHKLRSWNISDLSGEFKVTRDLFPSAAFYQIRSCATDADGNLTGYFSPPVEFDLRPESTNHKNFYGVF